MAQANEARGLQITRRELATGVAATLAAAGLATSMSARQAKASSAGAPDFQAFVDSLDDETMQTCCTVYEDGLGMLVDTNPEDVDGGDYTYTYSGYAAISAALDEFGLPRILFGMFTECSASDGWQSRIRNGFEVTWKYYPDAGLRVFFEYVGE